MALRTPALRGITASHVSLVRPQRRWARVADIRFVTHNASERVTDRYRDKLEQKRQQMGASDIDDLKNKYKDKISQLRKQASVPGATAPLQDGGMSATTAPSQSSAWPNPPPAPQAQTSSPPKDKAGKAPVKTLDSFLDVEKVVPLSPKEVEALWRLRHANNPASLGATLPAETWSSIYSTARKHPFFILPGLPRNATSEAADPATDASPEGAPIHLLQWTFPSETTVTVMFTHLAEYKLRGEHSQPHTTLTHHIDLAKSHGLVLCEGSVIDGRGVSLDEGMWLVMNMQKFYNIGEAAEQSEASDVAKQLKQKRRLLVEKFNSGSAEFKIEELLEEAERVG